MGGEFKEIKEIREIREIKDKIIISNFTKFSKLLNFLNLSPLSHLLPLKLDKDKAGVITTAAYTLTETGSVIKTATAKVVNI